MHGEYVGVLVVLALAMVLVAALLAAHRVLGRPRRDRPPSPTQPAAPSGPARAALSPWTLRRSGSKASS